MAELTETRITENNAASPKILLIQGPRQEAPVESAERRAPDQPGARPTALHKGRPPCPAPGTAGTPGAWVPRPPHACRLDGGLFVSISLAGMAAASSWGLVWPPLLPGKGSSQLPTQLPLFLTSPFLMWQLSAYHSARCQGNRRLPACSRRAPGTPGDACGAGGQGPYLGKRPRRSSPKLS